MVETPGPEKNAAKKKEQSKPLPRWLLIGHGALTLVATGVIAWATVTYTIYSGQQWKVMRGALRAATDANRFAQESNEATQRAWMLVEKIELTFKPHDKYSEWVSFRNRGRGPAFDVEFFVSYDFRPIGEEPPNPKEAEPCAGRSKSTVGQDATVSYKSDVRDPWPHEQWQSVVDGKERWYATGMITYRDQFKKLRRTSFCAFLDPATGQFNNCDRYNEAH